MKKQMIIVIILSIVSVMFVISARRKVKKRDLIIHNNLQESVRVEYELNNRPISYQIDPGKEWHGGQGFFKIHMKSRKGGHYEIRYPYPRPKNKPERLNVSDIMAAATQKRLDVYDYYTETGRIDDIEILYEGIPLFADSIW